LSRSEKIPVASEFTESKQASEETAMRVTRDALAVATIWMVDDSTYDTLDWHDHLLAAGVVPVAPYNPQNTDDTKNIEYRVEDRIEEHSDDAQLKQSILDETYDRRSQAERTTRTAASGVGAPEAASTYECRSTSVSICGSSSQPSTANADITLGARSSRYETYYITLSNHHEPKVYYSAVIPLTPML
jgi:hypothetical protein